MTSPLRPFFRSLPLLPWLAALAILLLLVPRGRAQTQPTWTNVAHNLGSNFSEITSVAYGNGTFVAVAALPIPGTTVAPLYVATSTDGLTWTSRTVNATLFRTYVSRIRFFNGRFIISYGGQVGADFGSARADFYATSTDGVTWTNIPQSAGISFTEMIFANGRYYVVTGSALISSTDLTNWTTHTTPLTGIFSFLDIAFGNGRFFATTNGAGGVVTSTDGTTWTQVPFFAQLGGYRAEFLDGTWFFYSQGNNAVSTDGTTFTSVVRSNTTPGGTASILAMNGRIIAPGPGYYWAGVNGRDWAQFGLWPTVQGSLFNSYFEVAYGAGRYVAVGSALLGRTYSGLIITLADASAPPLVFPVAPAITAAPVATAAVLGGPATFSVTATGAGNTYQWLKDNVAIAGATSATYTIAAVTAASAGNYSVRIVNSLGTVTSTPVALTLVTASNAGRLVNMSIRTGAGTGDATLIVGVGLGGAGTSGSKAVLLRGVGPTLGAFGVGGTLADPVMTVFQGTTQVAANDNWDAAAGATFGPLGAFAFAAGSRDAAIYNAAIPSGSYSIQIVGQNNGTGIALAEIYDATPASAFSAATPRLVNVSARTQVGTGDGVLIAGFVVGGQTPVRVLIRAVGPTLTAFGVGGALADPKLDVFSGTTVVASNDNWEAATAANFSRVGAFAFTAGSRDAALVATLNPGSYTAQVSGVNNTTGVALVEVYELP